MPGYWMIVAEEAQLASRVQIQPVSISTFISIFERVRRFQNCRHRNLFVFSPIRADPLQ